MPVIANRFHQRGTLIVVCLATAMLMLDIAVVNTALPYLARDLHAGLSGVQWVVDAYTLALAAVVLSAGSVSDRRGRRRVFTRGLLLFTFSSLVCAEASSIAVLDVARAVQGLAAALMFASSLAILADAFPSPRERAGALAAYGATIGGAFAIGPAVGGALTSGFGWRAVFFINVPLGGAGLLATARWLRESRDPSARRLDWPGQLVLTGGLFLLVLALLRGNTDGWGSAAIIAELIGGLVLLMAFVAVERRSPVPMLPLDLFHRRDFTAAQVAAFAISASFFALYLYMTLYLQDTLHLSPLDAGLVYMPGSVLLFVASGTSAQLAERSTPGRLVALGLTLVSTGLVLMTMTGSRSAWTAILPGDLLVCLGTGVLNPALGAIALGAASDANSGLLAGVNDAFRQGGLAIGVAAFGALVPPVRPSVMGPAARTWTAFITPSSSGPACGGRSHCHRRAPPRPPDGPGHVHRGPGRRRSSGRDQLITTVNPHSPKGTSCPSCPPSPRRPALSDKLVRPGDVGYDAARRAWNLAVDQRPRRSSIRRRPATRRSCSPTPVSTASRCRAGDRSQPRTPRLARGHAAGRTDRMRSVHIDPARRIARVEAGTLSLELVEAAAAHGLATLAGSSPDVGVVGYTLGGGLSWLGRSYGLAASHVRGDRDRDGRRATSAAPTTETSRTCSGRCAVAAVTSAGHRDRASAPPITEAYAGILWYPIDVAATCCTPGGS